MESTEEIKTRLDIADLIGEYLTLKPAGSGAFRAMCPFHHEKTPSFYVSRARQTWHCFGCDQGGDHFTFVEKIEGMDFREALEHLAQKVGVTLPQFDGEKSNAKKRLYEVHDLAVKYFRSVLNTMPVGEIARAYVARRGVDDLTSDLFQLGYAPNEWTAMTDALLKKGVTSEEMLQAGLVIKREQGNGVYDRFRGRVLFPIADVHGHIIGFTGRILTEDKEQAKYLNTPETALYHKSSVLYGLDKAKGEIRKQDLAVIVEGNMDVVSSHQFGITHVVAASGTALTQEQLVLLKRFTKNLAIAFDADAAGNTATVRGLDLARAQDFSIKIISLPSGAGKDPDEAIRRDPQIWKDAIRDAVSIMEWLYRNAFRNRHADRPEDKKLIARDLLPEVKRLVDPIERDHWVKRLAQDLGVGEEALREALGTTVRRTATPSRPTAPSLPPAAPRELGSPEEATERRLLALILLDPSVLTDETLLSLQTAYFSHAGFAGLYESLKSRYPVDQSKRGQIPTARLLRPPEGLSLEETSLFDSLAFYAEREFQELALDAVRQELKTSVEALRSLTKTRERTRLEQEMRDAERIGDMAKINELMQRFSSLS